MFAYVTSSPPSGFEGAQAGYLTKTVSSVVVRNEGDIVDPVDYTGSFGVEMVVEWHPQTDFTDWTSSYLARHANKAVANLGKGWHFSVGSLGGTSGDLSVSVSDGTNAVTATKYSAFTGKETSPTHLLLTYNEPTGQAILYINGVQAATNTNASVNIASSPAGELIIGAIYNVDHSTTWGTDRGTVTCRMHLMRVWEGLIDATGASDLNQQWQSKTTDLPVGISATVGGEWTFAEEVGDKDGGPGTGWIKDNIANNHLKMVNNSTYAGSIPNSSITVPTGTIACDSPADEASGVSGAVALSATGTVAGSASWTEYYFQVDEADTFNTGELRESGWVPFAYWIPRLKPGTTYFWRVKCRRGGTESSYAASRTFTTRAATTYYVRPGTTAGTYGTEDGSSYANACNDLNYRGSNGGMSLTKWRAMPWKLDLAPEDTLYICDDHGLGSYTSMAFPNYLDQRWIWAKGHDAASRPQIRADDATNPGRFWSYFKHPSAQTWTDEGGGIYSTATYVTPQGYNVNHFLEDDGTGKPNVDMDDLDWDEALYEDGSATLASPGFYISGGRLYVKTYSGTEPDTLWASGSGFAVIFTNVQQVDVIGGEFCGCELYLGDEARPGTQYCSIQDGKYRYQLGGSGYSGNGSNLPACFKIFEDVDDVTFTGNTFCFCGNGIYGQNSGPVAGTRRTGDRIIVDQNTFRHFEEGDNKWGDQDCHAIGWQVGLSWQVTNNNIAHCGSAITQWSSPGKSMDAPTPSVIQGNTIANVTNRSNTFGGGITLEGGGSASDRGTFAILDNIIHDCDGPGIHISGCGDQAATYDGENFTGLLLKNNDVQDVGLNPKGGNDDIYGHGITFRNNTGSALNLLMTANYVANWKGTSADGNFPKALILNGTSIGAVSINNNQYWHDTLLASSDGCFRRMIATTRDDSFDTWKASSGFDADSTWAIA